MVEHPEEKLKGVGIAYFVLSILGGLVVASSAGRHDTVLFFAVFAAIVFVGYIFAVLLCGLGNLIENSNEILELMKAEKQVNNLQTGTDVEKSETGTQLNEIN